MEGKVYLTLSDSILSKLKKEARDAAIETFGEENTDDLLFEQIIYYVDEIDYDDGELAVSGELYYQDKNLGYLSIDLPLSDINVIIKITEDYVKRLNKLKNVLESIK